MARLGQGLDAGEQNFGFGHKLALLSRQTKGVGKALLGALDGRKRRWPREDAFKAKFDLILLDCGPLSPEFDLVPVEEVGAAIVVDQSRGERGRIAILFASQTRARAEEPVKQSVATPRRARA